MQQTLSADRRPAHVLPELFWDNSLPAFMGELDDPWLAASRLHDGPDLIWAADVAYGEPGWIVTRHTMMQEVMIDYEHFRSGGDTLARLLGVKWQMNPIGFNPPEHRDYRRILNPFFSPKGVRELETAVRGICNDVVGLVEGRGSCDFIGEFAALYPSYVFLELMGMPRSMLPQFLGWEADFMRPPVPEARAAAGREILNYLTVFLDRSNDGPRSPLVNAILTAEIDGRLLDEDEIMGMGYILYLGGLDTVYSALGWYMRHLARDQALQQRLRENPADIPKAIDEFARAYAVSKATRYVASDFVFHGVPLRAGDPIHVPTWFAARDDRIYDSPHEIDIDRRSRAVSFGIGHHICLGMHLAKREIRIMLETLLARFSSIRLVEGEPMPFHGGAVLGLDRLMIEWDLAK